MECIIFNPDYWKSIRLFFVRLHNFWFMNRFCCCHQVSFSHNCFRRIIIIQRFGMFFSDILRGGKSEIKCSKTFPYSITQTFWRRWLVSRWFLHKAPTFINRAGIYLLKLFSIQLINASGKVNVELSWRGRGWVDCGYFWV